MFSQTEKIDTTKLIEFLNTKWGQRSCPMCGVYNWSVQDMAYEIRGYLPWLLPQGGPRMPIIPVVCKNCGNTVLVNAIISGIIPPQQGEEAK